MEDEPHSVSRDIAGRCQQDFNGHETPPCIAFQIKPEKIVSRFRFQECPIVNRFSSVN